MNEHDATRLGDMLDAARNTQKYVTGITGEAFVQNEILALALVKTIEIIGEAASKVSADTRQQYPEIRWRDVIGMRNKLIHNYLEIDFNVVWDVIKNDIPVLIAQLERILPPETDNE